MRQIPISDDDHPTRVLGLDSSLSSGSIVGGFPSVRVASLRSAGIVAGNHPNAGGTLTKSNPSSIATSMHEHGWGQENEHSQEHVVEDGSRGTDTTEELRNGDAESIGGSTRDIRNLNNNTKGSIFSDFTSVRVASMRSSGIVACRHLGLGGTVTESNPTSSILEDQQKLGKSNNCKQEYDQTSTSSKPTSLVGTRNSRIRNSRVRRLFREGTDGIEETRNKIARRKEMDCSILDDHAVGDLNYVVFEEPGEQLQQHALGVVDKIVSINDFELDAGGNGLPGVNWNSLPVSRASGAQSMATRVNPRSPLTKKGIYDWIDSRENDGGGDFFIRKKDALLAGIETNDPTFKTQRKFSNLKGKGETMSSQSRKKQRGEDSGTELRKNLFEETAELSNKEFDVDAINRGPQDMSGVGVSTHLAAVIGSSASRNFRDAYQAISELTEDPNIASTKHKDQQMHAATKKRTSSSTSPNSCRKKLKSLSRKDFRRNSPVQTRSRGKLKLESFTNGGNSAKGNDCFNRKNSKLDMGGQVLASTAIDLKEVDKLSELESNTHLSNNKGHEKHCHGTVTPVAHRTRQSIGREISFTTHESAISSAKRQCSEMGPDHLLAPESKISRLEMGRSECGNYPKRRRTCQSMSAGSTQGTLNAVITKKTSTALDRAPSVPVSTDALPRVGDATASLCASKSSNLHEIIKMDSSQMPLKNTAPVSVACPPKDTSASQAGQRSALKDICQLRDMATVRVLFSHHLSEDLIKQQKKILACMGGFIASSPLDATHFIADEFEHTRNMLETVALGKPVVTHLWLENCAQASCYADEKKYLLRDSKKEMEVGFDMPVSLALACQSPLLQGKRVLITHNIKPDKKVIARLVKAVHGQAIERVGRSYMKDKKVADLLVISCEEDYSICEPLLERGADVYSSELILNGIINQKLEYGRHRLFTDLVKRTRSTIRLRKDKDHQFRPVAKCE